jgi:hypothetical protein
MRTLQLDLAQTYIHWGNISSPLVKYSVIIVVYIWRKYVGAAIFDIRILREFVWFAKVICTLEEANKILPIYFCFKRESRKLVI